MMSRCLEVDRAQANNSLVPTNIQAFHWVEIHRELVVVFIFISDSSFRVHIRGEKLHMQATGMYAAITQVCSSIIWVFSLPVQPLQKWQALFLKKFCDGLSLLRHKSDTGAVISDSWIVKEWQELWDFVFHYILGFSQIVCVLQCNWLHHSSSCFQDVMTVSISTAGSFTYSLHFYFCLFSLYDEVLLKFFEI